jgi:zinc transporter ZupT
VYSKWEAIRAQFITAVGAFAGTVIGLLAERNKEMETLMLAMTSGGFLYIATVSILPIVVSDGARGGHCHGHTHGKKDDDDGDDEKNGTTVVQVLCEAFAFSAGVGFMVAVAYLE